MQRRATFSPQVFQPVGVVLASLAAASERGAFCDSQHVVRLKESPTGNRSKAGTRLVGRRAKGSGRQISDRVTRKDSAELSMARMKVSSLEYCSMMLSSMFTRTLESKVSTTESRRIHDLNRENVVFPTFPHQAKKNVFFYCCGMTRVGSLTVLPLQ